MDVVRAQLEKLRILEEAEAAKGPAAVPHGDVVESNASTRKPIVPKFGASIPKFGAPVPKFGAATPAAASASASSESSAQRAMLKQQEEAELRQAYHRSIDVHNEYENRATSTTMVQPTPRSSDVDHLLETSKRFNTAAVV